MSYKFYVFQVDHEHNAPEWWENGGAEIWSRAQIWAGNHTRETALAITADDRWGFFEGFTETPGWNKTEPLIVTEIDTDEKREAADRLTDLGVTRANLRALDLASSFIEEEE